MFQYRLKIFREAAGFTSQKEFALKLGVSQSAVGNWESGTRVPDLKMLQRISEVLNVSISDLIGERIDCPVSFRNNEVMVSIPNPSEIDNYLFYQYRCNSAQRKEIMKGTDKKEKIEWLSEFFEVSKEDLIAGRFPLRKKESVVDKINHLGWTADAFRRSLHGSELTDEQAELLRNYQAATEEERAVIRMALSKYGGGANTDVLDQNA